MLKEILVYQILKYIHTTNGVKLFETPRTREYVLLFLIKENENLDSEKAKVENLKTKVFSHRTVFGAIFRQSVSENYQHIFSKTKHH